MKDSLAVAYAMKKRKHMGMGESQSGESTTEPLPTHGDIVDRIIAKKYSKGGMVANDTEIDAGFAPANFDDLALRDDLEGTNSGAADGDFLGNEQEDKDRDDIVMRAMNRRIKQTNPRPA